jgi:integrin beta 1
MSLRRSVPLFVLLASCGSEEPFQARFTVRGRWAGECEVVYRIEAQGGPVPAAAVRRAIAAAMAAWSATGCASFREACEGEVPGLVLGWRTGAHGACAPFGTDPGVAHAGPVGPESFVHFDAARAWSAPGFEQEGGLSLEQAALHEIGHVLGLDHSPDEDSAMHPEPSAERARLSRGDLDGIHSLYGGGRAAPGDLEVSRADGSLALVLHEVAPAGVAEWSLFDSDGDGDLEVLVAVPLASTGGALWAYHFAPGPVLERTVGPMYGVTGPRARVSFAVGAGGRRLVLIDHPDAPLQARAFDEHGLVRALEEELELPAAAAEELDVRTGDLDGDGTAETVRWRR